MEVLHIKHVHAGVEQQEDRIFLALLSSKPFDFEYRRVWLYRGNVT